VHLTPHLLDPALDYPAAYRFGRAEYVKGTAPAAGAHFTQTVGGDLFVRLLTVSARLVTDATVASRELVLQYRDNDGTVYAQQGINATVAASQTADYFFSAFQPQVVATVNGSSLVPLWPLILVPTHDFRLFVVNVQAGDQLSRIRFVWERFYTTGAPPSYTPGG